MKNIGPIARWRNYKQIHTLTGSRCVACQKLFFPRKYLCLCGSKTFEPYTFSGQGTLVTFTKIYNGPEHFEKMVPYFLGIVELEGNVKVLSKLVGVSCKDLKIGMPVSAVFRKLYEEGKKGVINYGIVFEPNTSL